MLEAAPAPISLSARDVLYAATLACLLVLPGLWAFTLIDPWEGHYAEVARRILQDNDWVALRWQSAAFHSKPALTPWLIAASMHAHGLATEGGFSGELVAAPGLTAWAVRLPFALFGIAGMMSIWLVLTRLVSRRAGYIGLVVLGTTPFYLLVARQAITDMPMVAAATAAIAFAALAIHDGERPLRKFIGRLGIHHLALFAIAFTAGAQALYNARYFMLRPELGPGMHGVHALAWVTLPTLAAVVLLTALSLFIWPMRRMRDFYLLCAYSALGLSILAKGPPGAVLAVAACLLYLVSTRQLRLVVRMRIPEGLLIVALIAAPWHMAITLRDGQPFLVEYIGHHWLRRAGEGVHMVNRNGEGTFRYFVQELGYGLWPYVCLLPAAVISAWNGPVRTPRQHLRLIALIWTIAGLVLFTALKTKYHHYVLPAVPGVALLLALWLDEVWAKVETVNRTALAFGVLASAGIGYDIARNQERLIELFIYRYDRPWPAAAPWHVDLSTSLAGFAILFVAVGVALAWPRFARYAAATTLAVGVIFSVYLGNVYMSCAAPHWGQGQLHASYYKKREIYGLTLRYESNAQLLADWPQEASTVRANVLAPEHLRVGASFSVQLVTPAASRRIVGNVTQRGDAHLVATLPHGWREHFDGAVASGNAEGAPRMTLDADPLIAWNLHWRSELFWSGGELWSDSPGGHRMFKEGQDREFLALLGTPDFAGRTVYVMTSANQTARLRTILSEVVPKLRLEVVDNSSNKFTLLRFRLSSSATFENSRATRRE